MAANVPICVWLSTIKSLQVKSDIVASQIYIFGARYADILVQHRYNGADITLKRHKINLRSET